jgi:hypothetical protein
MRKSVLALSAATLALVPASVAFAADAFKQSSKIGFTTQRSGVSAGISSNVTSSDPSALGTKPKPARTLVITFPANTRFNLGTSAVNACHLTDKQMLKPLAQFPQNGLQCPKSSQVGSGTAKLNTWPMTDPLKPADVTATVKVFRHIHRTLYIIVYPSLKQIPSWQPWILHATASGSKLRITIPAQVYGKGKCKPVACLPHGITASLVMLKFKTWPAGSGSNALVRSGKCASGKFKYSSHFTFEDRSQLTVGSSSKCSR